MTGGRAIESVGLSVRGELVDLGTFADDQWLDGQI